ncbi:Mediator of RNA polymerase II transcription subunit [Paramyrothecium foliicola]|nr:Mediator of RNA polymerase II transcription subunit [Paramyrothecium foliicola]
MSTPMRHAPSQQGRTPSQLAAATPPVSTPFSNPAHAAFSPRGPRSSPQQVKKSPATSNLLGQSAAGALNFDSPSTAAAMGALGIGGTFDMALDNVGVGALDGLNVGFTSEDDKLKRLDYILALLNKKKGLVSEAGLERLAQRLGLEILSEENTGPDGRKTKTLVIAGSAIALDIVLDNNIVKNISLAFHGSGESVAKHADAASQILVHDLQLLPGQSPLTKSLDDFAANFERLAKLDKLSISPGLDCHDALAGVYTSLDRLYEWDLSRLKEQPEMNGKSDQYLAAMAMCSRHGRPVMHSRGKVGLAIQYWKQFRFIPPSDGDIAAFSEKTEQVWSLLLGCAAIEGLGLPPVRVSENWISKSIFKEDPTADPKMPTLDWQEPENIVLPPSEENKDAGMEMLQPDLSTARVPRVMFNVTFDPPVILPQNDWMRLYAYAGVDPPDLNALNDFTHRVPPTFDTLFFPIAAGTKQDPSEPRTITRRRTLRVFDGSQSPKPAVHRNTLFIYKPIYSQEVREMPFSHPRQLIDMLPLLRQYAFLSTLLENSFGRKTEVAEKSPIKTDKSSNSSTTTGDDLADFMSSAGLTEKAEDQPPQTDAAADLDVILWVHPMPHLQVVFPLRDATVDITFRILEGGVVEVASENVLARAGEAASSGTKYKKLTREDLGKALEHLEDLCKWVEWVRRRLS